MAIRPTDLQSALIVSTQAPPINQRAEQAPIAAQNAAQAQFAAKAEERNERVASDDGLHAADVARFAIRAGTHRHRSRCAGATG
jgi:hypothetical protein